MGMKLSMPLKGKGVKKIFSKKKKGVEIKRIGSSSKNGLPEDLVFEILLLLPVKSVLRFRCVCKSWYDLIGNPSFVSMHYYKSRNDDTSKIIVKHQDDVLLLSYETLEVSQDLDLTPVKNIVGSCYGIICFCGVVLKEYSVNLWNPSTRQFKVLPKPHHMIGDFGVEFGFCYDVKTNDFKVVKFVSLDGSRGDSHWVAHAVHPTPRAEVYSLSTDSWKIIDNTFQPRIYMKPWKSVNGVLSNLSDARGIELKFETKNFAVLISFDTRDEVFLITPLPAPCAGTRMANTGDIVPLNESVAYAQVLYGSTGEFSHIFHIWVLNEYGSKGSWTKLYTIGEPNSNLLCITWGFWKNSMLLMENEKGQLVLCDRITQEIKNLQVDEQLNILDLISYKESLVSI